MKEVGEAERWKGREAGGNSVVVASQARKGDRARGRQERPAEQRLQGGQVSGRQT
jgi:hypothetical protein